MKIKCENAYEDGWESESVEEVPEFTGDPDDEDALEEFLQTYTGDGHGAGNDLGYFYEIVILEAANPDLVGRSMEWCGK